MRHPKSLLLWLPTVCGVFITLCPVMGAFEVARLRELGLQVTDVDGFLGGRHFQISINNKLFIILLIIYSTAHAHFFEHEHELSVIL